MSWMTGTFSAFALRDYRRFWLGSTMATTAFMMSFMLVPSVAFEISGSNAAAGLAQMGSGIGMFVVSPIGGVVADRMRKKPLVFAGQAIPATVIALTGVVILLDLITIPLLTVATFVMGLGFAFMGPARQAWVGELVPPKLFPNAIALQQIAQNTSQVAGPLLIALLVGTWLGIGGTYLFMASMFVIILPITARLPNTTPAEKERHTVRHELVEGLRYVWREPRLRTLWLGFMAMVVCGFAFQTLLPGMLSEELDRPSTDVGMIFLALAIAGLASTIPLAGFVRSARAWSILLVAGLVMALGFICLSRAPSYGLAIVAAIPLGIGRSSFMLVDNSLLMSNARPAYHGRVMSLAMMGFGSQALLAPVWGALADSVGVRTTLMVAGVAAAAVTSLMGVSYLQIRRQEAMIAPLDAMVETAPAPRPI
jgi:MFS family permease